MKVAGFGTAAALRVLGPVRGRRNDRVGGRGWAEVEAEMDCHPRKGGEAERAIIEANEMLFAEVR